MTNLFNQQFEYTDYGSDDDDNGGCNALTSSEDEFEKDMTDELDQAMRVLAHKNKQLGIPSVPCKNPPDPSNDDLLYDPEVDDADQRWIDGQRRRYHPHVAKNNKLPSSDAVLDCPACMTTLCLDCQRHVSYKHQYRAMFVMNCKVDHTAFLDFPQETKKNRKRKINQEPEPEAEAPSEEKFNPVHCRECNTTVAMMDKDEVFHFYNVLASHA